MTETLLEAAPAWAWGGFFALVVLLLAADLGVFNRKVHAPSFKESAAWSCVWIGLALLFNVVVWASMGADRGVEWFTCYVLEKSLSVDNLFVFVMVFQAFAVETRHQHRILYWGILGALVFRAAMILGGTALLNRFGWSMYVFGVFLIWTGLRSFFPEKESADPSGGFVVRLFTKVVPYDPEGGHLRPLSRAGGRLRATPMLLVLLVVELTDLVFAVDSIPAVLAITRDVFVVFTSNIFAILGLRSLYFLLAGMMDGFRGLKAGLAVVLTFVGLKMCLAPWLKERLGVSDRTAIVASLTFITAVLLCSTVPSLLSGGKSKEGA